MNAVQPSLLQIPKAIFYSNGYVEYHPGNLNIIISVPHGGRLKPASIPDRDAGCCVNGKVVYDHKCGNKDYMHHTVRTKSDVYTSELSIMVAAELLQLTKRSPHIVINQLYRAKLDANCALEKATFNVDEAKTAWYKYHECIDGAKHCINGPGLFLDIHGQSHPEGWVELGYTLTAEQLDECSYKASMTSVRSIAERTGLDIHRLICGEHSFGACLETEGYPAVPSLSQPSPKGKHYYTGGYNTERHGSKTSGMIDGIQIECPRTVRKESTAPAFSKALAQAVYKFWLRFYQEPAEVVES